MPTELCKLTGLGVPTLKVLSRSGESSNEVGSEYILMEEAKGSQLGEVWNEMELCDEFKIIEGVSSH